MKKNQALGKENLTIQSQMKDINHHLVQETIKRDELEAYGRRPCIEISGIPRMDEENCYDISEAVAKLMGLSDFRKNTIDVAHRLSDTPAANIIVKFKNRTSRDMFFANRKNLKGKTVRNLFDKDDVNRFENETSGIYINESLTAYKKSLFWKARNRAMEVGWTGTGKLGRCWTSNGSILVCTDKNSKAIIIRLESDLDRIN